MKVSPEGLSASPEGIIVSLVKLHVTSLEELRISLDEPNHMTACKQIIKPVGLIGLLCHVEKFMALWYSLVP